ncbi:hypothetical protein H8356DRAFT_1403438 [Neocallimastix lanati (nom. inval.)]|nr:hypothetical protein H8356DRAFT_1403438 [Neocallimastix sp. JGI-2020a]
MSISTSIYNNNYPKNQNLYYQSQSIDRIMEYLDKNINLIHPNNSITKTESIPIQNYSSNFDKLFNLNSLLVDNTKSQEPLQVQSTNHNGNIVLHIIITSATTTNVNNTNTNNDKIKILYDLHKKFFFFSK